MTSEIRESREGVQVRKHFADSEFDLPSVVYELISERSETVTVRIVEGIPDGLGPEHIGFHTELGRDDWTLTEGEIVFEADIEGGDEYRTVYALRPDGDYEPEQLVTAPDEFVVEEAAPAPPERATAGTFVRSAGSAGDGATAVSSPAGGGGSLARDSGRVGDADRPGEPSVVDRLVAELQAGTVSEERLDYLRQALDGTSRDGSVDARIDQLQSDLADVRTYANAMEQFLDEHGSVEGVVSTFEKRLDALGAEIDALASTVRENEAAVEDLRAEVGELSEELDSVTEELSTVAAETEDLSTEASRLDEEASRLDGELSQLDEELSALDEQVTSDLESRVSDLEAEVSEFTEALQEAFQP